MSIDDQIDEALLSAITGLRAQLEKDVSAFGRELIAATQANAQQSELDNIARLLDEVRALDAATSLSQVLDTLADCAGREVGRAAVLLVRGGRIQGWRASGFSADIGQVRAIVLDLDAAGIAGAAVRTAKAAILAEADELALPSFARSGDGGRRHALALPVTVGGEVVAVLYADEPVSAPAAATTRWTLVLDVLVRHASRSLEALTIQHAMVG